MGAHLAAGVPLHELGTPIDDPIRLALPRPQITAIGLRGEIIFIDDFGNLHTNMVRQELAPLGEINVRLCDVEIEGLVRTFGQRPPGALIGLNGTEHDLIISVVNGNAAAYLNAQVGNVVEVVKRHV